MMLCHICNQTYHYSSFPKHLKKVHLIGCEEYFLRYIGTRGHCLQCGEPTKFISISKGYYKYCTPECSYKSNRRRKNIEKTCLKKYGVKTPFLNNEIKEKRRKKLLSNYNVEHPAQSPIIKEQMVKTCLLNYGVDNPNKSECIKELKIKNSIEKYGTAYPTQTENFKKKALKTKRDRFINKLFYLERLQNRCRPNFSIDEYNGVHQNYSWICCNCNTIFNDYLVDGRLPRCPLCYPKISGASILEKEVFDFCKHYYPEAISHDYSILENKELDIYIPEINLAIEFNGLYWHSELNGINSKYHLDKLEKCLTKNVNLIHIFEDEWYDKEEIVKSILLTKMGKINTKIYARKCILKSVDKDESQNFLFENHLQGSINGQSLGLYYNNDLVSILTYGKPRFNKNFDIEILRFCNKKNLIVVGGLSKLISKLSGHIITYCDRRFSNGEGYKTAGFNLVSISPPNYYYLKKGKRFSRMQFQKHKLPNLLETFDLNLSEWENMQLNNYDRIWDCGNLIFERKQ